MKIINTLEPVKLCHARTGDVVAANGCLCIVARRPTPGKAPPLKSSHAGLYDYPPGELFLVRLDNGHVIEPMPHLSSKIALRDDVVLVATADIAEERKYL